VTATVTKYANYSFEVRSADGKTLSYPGSGVRRILFDSLNAQAKFTTRTLEQMARTDPEIAVRKIDIVDWTTPVVKQYNVHAIP
jgi:hypothetical protein